MYTIFPENKSFILNIILERNIILEKQSLSVLHLMYFYMFLLQTTLFIIILAVSSKTLSGSVILPLVLKEVYQFYDCGWSFPPMILKILSLSLLAFTFAIEKSTVLHCIIDLSLLFDDFKIIFFVFGNFLFPYCVSRLLFFYLAYNELWFVQI